MFHLFYGVVITWHLTVFRWRPGLGRWGAGRVTGYTVDWCGVSFGYDVRCGGSCFLVRWVVGCLRKLVSYG